MQTYFRTTPQVDTINLSKRLNPVPSDEDYSAAILLARSLEQYKHADDTDEQAAYLEADRERSRMLVERQTAKANRCPSGSLSGGGS